MLSVRLSTPEAVCCVGGWVKAWVAGVGVALVAAVGAVLLMVVCCHSG